MTIRSPVVLDASAALVLFATGQIAEIIAELSAPVFVVKETIAEVRFLRDVSDSGQPGGQEPIVWQQLLDRGTIGLLERSDDQEFSMYIRYAQSMDDGEAAAAAAAYYRGYSLAIDDLKARKILGESIELVWSLDILQQWCHRAGLASEDIRQTLTRVRLKATYQPHRAHPCWSWWNQHSMHQ